MRKNEEQNKEENWERTRIHIFNKGNASTSSIYRYTKSNTLHKIIAIVNRITKAILLVLKIIEISHDKQRKISNQKDLHMCPHCSAVTKYKSLS